MTRFEVQEYERFEREQAERKRREAERTGARQTEANYGSINKSNQMHYTSGSTSQTNKTQGGENMKAVDCFTARIAGDEEKQELIQELMKASVYLRTSRISNAAKPDVNIGDLLVKKPENGVYEATTAVINGQIQPTMYSFAFHNRLFLTVANAWSQDILEKTGFQSGTFWKDDAKHNLPVDAIIMAQEMDEENRRQEVDFKSYRIHEKAEEYGIKDLSHDVLACLVPLEGDIYDVHSNLMYRAIDVHSSDDWTVVLDRAGTYDCKNGIVFLISSYGTAYVGKGDNIVVALRQHGYVRTPYPVPFAEPCAAPKDAELEKKLIKYLGISFGDSNFRNSDLLE